MLQITQTQGILEVKGSLMAENVNSLSSHLNVLLQKGKDVVLSLDKLDAMDQSGMMAIAKLYKQAIKNNKIFYVIGKSNKKIASIVANPIMRYVIREDRL